jgi:putative SOS response-associated peptidase YedK
LSSRDRHEARQAVFGGLWENWKDPKSPEWVRTFAVITPDANSLVAQIHNRILILASDDYNLNPSSASMPSPILLLMFMIGSQTYEGRAE